MYYWVQSFLLLQMVYECVCVCVQCACLVIIKAVLSPKHCLRFCLPLWLGAKQVCEREGGLHNVYPL